MKVRICPLCDSEMKKAHYCDTCHSFVWRPDILDVHYNAQQRGLGEEDCSYGEIHDQRDHDRQQRGRFSDVLKKSGKKSENSSSHEEVYGTDTQKMTANQRENKTSDTDRNKRKAGGCLAKIILAVIILNAVLGSVGSNLFNFFTGDNFRYYIEKVLDELGIEDDIPVWKSGSETVDEIDGDDENEYKNTAFEQEKEYLDSDDISHFEITKDELEEFLSAWVNTEYGRAIQKTADDIDQETIYEDEDGNEYTVPELASYYSMGTDQDYLIVYTDSQTGEVCAVMASFREEEHADKFFAAAASMLDPDSDYDQADWEKVLDDLNNQVMENYDEQSGYGNGRVDSANMTVSVSEFSDGEICLTFEAVDFY